MKDEIRKRDQQTITDDNRQRVYRVIQCQENELTHVSCGRKFLVNVSPIHENLIYSNLLISDGFANERRLEIRAVDKHRNLLPLRER